ncbi:response regulator [Marinomonas transparens]|uniref:Response regulator n=1 Tax=Marinomonas transparens TaxID=2795388 RepID=A0A934JT44_9GAMM|nr:response regulator [Marinomonas transparens]MBJ7536885.1 response regulator [Marinomonas transparens]
MTIDFTKKKVLVIEDLSEARVIQKKMLLELGFSNVDIVAKADTALELLNKNTYDIVMSDYNLGKGKNGQQILEEVRTAKLIPNTSTYIMVTAETSMEMVMGAVEFQPDGYIAKPFSQALLHRRIISLVENKEKLIGINTALDKKDYQKAIDECLTSIETHPFLKGKCQRILCECYVELKQYDKALKVYNDVLNDRQMPWALFGKAKIQFLQKKFTEAENNFRQLTFDNQFFVNAYDWLAKCFLAQDRFKDAQQMLIKSVDKAPQNITRQALLAQLSMDLQDYELAETAYRKAIALAKHSFVNPPDIYIKHLVSLIRICQKQKHLDAKQKQIFERTSQRIKYFFEHDKKTMTHRYELNVDLQIVSDDQKHALQVLSDWKKEAAKGNVEMPRAELELRIENLQTASA